ncbi:MAG: efflux RND transporter periplasmic adaptor subunit [Cyanobacteria bacterium J06631_6]
MNSATEQTKIIGTLLTYPDRAAKILAVHSDIIDCELVNRIEQFRDRMKSNGSQEAAAFLASLIPHLNQLIDTTNINSWQTEEIETYIDSKITIESAKPNQPETNAYRYLIDALLTYPNQTTELLASHPNLLDRHLIEMMKKLAVFMAANGSQDAAAFLCDLIVQLTSQISTLEVIESEKTKALTTEATGKNRFASFSGIALVTFLALLGVNHKFGYNLFEGLSQVLATDSDNTAEKVLANNTSSVETIEIDLVQSYQSTRNYSGQVVARQDSELSFPRAGKLASITVREGDFVAQGTPLAYLNTDNLQNQQQELLARKARAIAQLKELQAGARPETIAAAKAVVSNFQGQLESENQKRLRRASLYAEGAISREQFEEITASAASLKARVDEAQSELDRLQAGTRPERIAAQQAAIRELDANLANIQIELNKSILKAPFTGTISQRQIDEGAVVDAGQSIFNLVEDRVLEAHIGIPLNQSEQIKQGETVTLKIGKHSHQAKVASLLPELDTNTRTVTAILNILNLEQQGDRRIFPGQIAQLPLTQTVAKSGFWLPIESLVRGERGLWHCYVVVPTASEPNITETEPIFRLERRAVEVLHSSNNRVLIRGTLQPGDRVITNDIERLVSGQLVTLK